MPRLIDADALVDALMTYTWRDENERLIDDADEKRAYIEQWLPNLPTVEPLKAQEPRVLTLEEVLGGDECWFEYINGSFGYADVLLQDNTTALIYRTIVGTGEVPISDYGKKWRCWSYGPTAEQRKAMKWDG